MERAPRRPVKAHDGAPSGLVDPRRSGAVTQRPQGHGSNSARARVVAGVTRPTHCLTTGGLCGRIILDLRRPMPGQSQPVRGGSCSCVASRRLGAWEVDRTTRRRTPSSAGSRSQTRQPGRSPARSHENPQSEGGRGAADRAVERFLGPTVEKITRVALASRAGLRSDTPWPEILEALDRLEGRHRFDSALVAMLRWLAQPRSESSPQATGPGPSAKQEGRSTK